MKKIVLILLTCLCAFISKSQLAYVKGYIITAKGDTLKGEVKINPKKEHENYSKCFFKDAAGLQRNNRPEKIKGYGFNDEHFITIKNEGETKFYKRLSDGPIVFYKVAFAIMDVDETFYDYDYFLTKTGDEKLTNVKQNKFKKQITEWMVGNTAFANEFKDEKIFNEKSAIDVINKYNEWKKK